VTEKKLITNSKKKNMASKVFLDANFLLDLTLQRAGFQQASDLVQHALNGRIRLYTTPAVLHITGYYTSQAYGFRQAKHLLLALLNDVQIIDSDHTTALMALNSNMGDIEDALQYYTAIKFGMDYFVSADKKLKKEAIPQLPVYTAEELLSELG
jgi:predicted nucleic acid-binding protein